MNNHFEKYEKAMELKQNGHLEKSRNLFLQAVNEEPENAEYNFFCGQVHDAQGLEQEAAHFYEKAMEKGLADDLLKDAYVCLASTYNVLGKSGKSLELLETGEQRFPHYLPIQVFKSLTLHKLHRHSQALGKLLNVLTETTGDKGIKAYSRALKYYAEQLERQP